MNGPTDSTEVRHLAQPAFLLNAPFSLESKLANNATMQKLGPTRRRIQRDVMWKQWTALYRHLTAQALVYLLPSNRHLQDQPYVANLGLVPAHTRRPTAILAKFRAQGRTGEPKCGAPFFRSMGFTTVTCASYFEGEADLKYLRDAIYFGGHGLRSSLTAQHWLEKRFDFQIVPIPLWDPHLYHLDCVLHVLDRQRILFATAAASPETVRVVEKVAEIVDVPLPLAYRGVTNAVRCGAQFLCDSALPELKKSDPLYALERAKRKFVEQLTRRFALEPHFINLSEFYKSGAMLSCLVLPLNYPHLR